VVQTARALVAGSTDHEHGKVARRGLARLDCGQGGRVCHSHHDQWSVSLPASREMRKAKKGGANGPDDAVLANARDDARALVAGSTDHEHGKVARRGLARLDCGQGGETAVDGRQPIDRSEANQSGQTTDPSYVRFERDKHFPLPHTCLPAFLRLSRSRLALHLRHRQHHRRVGT
jgi:hypothetical protein